MTSKLKHDLPLLLIFFVLLIGASAIGFGLKLFNQTPLPGSQQNGSKTGSINIQDATLPLSYELDEPNGIRLMRNSIENLYPEFKTFEHLNSFAGNAVTYTVKNGTYYFAYEILGSGVPVAQANCFAVSSNKQVTKIGTFPQPNGQGIGFSNVDPTTCQGIK